MNNQHFTEQKVIIPSAQGLEEIEQVDKTKVFWTVLLAIFVVGFVFILGYWIGQQKATADYFKIMPSSSVDVSPLVGVTDYNQNMSEIESPQIPNNNNNNEMIEQDGINALDSAVTGNTIESQSPTSNIENNASNNYMEEPIITPSVDPLNNNIKITSRNNVPKEPTSGIKPRVSPIVQGAGIIPHYRSQKGKWAVRLATVGKESNAKALVNKLNKLGYKNVNMLKIGVLYRVSVLGFESQANAKEFQKQAKTKLNLSDTLIIKL